MSLINEAASRLKRWLRPVSPGGTSATWDLANALSERNRLADLLAYRAVNDDNNLIYLDEGTRPICGFMLEFHPLLLAGCDAEPQLEAIVNACPPDSIVEFGVLSSPYISPMLNWWAQARKEKNTNSLLHQVADRRRDFMLATSMGLSMLAGQKMHGRHIRYFISVRVPFKGNPSSIEELVAWESNVKDIRDSATGALTGAGITAYQVKPTDFRMIVRELLNPQLPPDERVQEMDLSTPLHKDLVDRASRMRVAEDGSLRFSSTSDEDAELAVACLTVDKYPETNFLPNTAELFGDPKSREERIAQPFWAYTKIHVLDPDKARERMTAKLGALNKQAMSDSEWYKSMMSHLFDARQDVQDLLANTRKGHQLVRAYSGINICTEPKNINRDVQYVKSLWRRAGFRCSQERFITLPVFLASLPLHYSPEMDPPGKGMQRATTVSSLNAASFGLVQGDWPGTHPSGGGPLLVSRRGQLASFDLLKTSSNYNFIVVATSGAGKSFLMNEIVADFLSKKGIIRIVDVGRSYERFCRLMGGQYMVFDPKNPVSMNPFYGIEDEAQLNEMMPMLKTMLRQMAYPLQKESDTAPWEYQVIEAAIVGAWEVHKGGAELAHVHDWLKDHGDARASDLADQLHSFAYGRYKAWFSGPRKLAFDNDLVILELEELDPDPELKAIVLTLSIHEITKEMYLSSRERPKLLAIDEAWSLLGNVQTGSFIETAFRRARKYNGIAGVITQSFEDFEKSPAARAAIENAAWQFVLYQRPESLEFAIQNKRLIANEYLTDLVRSVMPGDGFSEVYIRSESGQGVYRFVVDKHSYYTYTTKPEDINRLDALVAEGCSVEQAIDKLAREDYRKMWKTKGTREGE